MTSAMPVTDVSFVAASATDREAGLLGWIALTLPCGLRLDGITLRRTREGRLTLAFPERTDGRGRRHALVRPVNTDARRAIEAAIFDALGLLRAEDGP